MMPWNKFDLKRSTIKDERFSPIHAGMLPESLFSPMSKVTNLLAIFKDLGRSP
ncbi:hypothetical protein DsansV1_C05g0053691 [Dioscorea sansibarensis]